LGLLNRRRFLMYAGATASVVGASALGLGYLLRPTPSIKQTFMSSTEAISTTSFSSTSSVTTTETSTSGELPPLDLGANDLGGYVFHDYSGNGALDEDEPFVNDVEIVAQGYNAAFKVEPQNGTYVFKNLPGDRYRLYPVHPQNKFRYMCRSNAELVETKQGYTVDFRGRQRLDMALMEGFLTLPFPKGTPIYVDPVNGDFFDHDPGPDALWWNGQRLPAPRPHTPEYAHPEIDFFMPEGTEVKAAVSGRVNGIRTESDGVKWISLSHLEGYGTTYLHIGETRVPVGAYANRGDTIALSSNTGTHSSDDFHTAFQIWRHMSDGYDYCIDPYSPVAGVPKGAWIAGIWKWSPSDEEWISEGYWTKFNDPQYPVQ